MASNIANAGIDSPPIARNIARSLAPARKRRRKLRLLMDRLFADIF
ncbi:MAG: hypothetical protein O6934_13340 [SAR324 cluster bacterium]|nr:hypothetical protein [SAR324 cluster bacterium]